MIFIFFMRIYFITNLVYRKAFHFHVAKGFFDLILFGYNILSIIKIPL